MGITNKCRCRTSETILKEYIEIIIPVQAAYLPIKGLEQLLKTISRVKRKMNPKLHIMGILLTMVDYRTNYAYEKLTKEVVAHE